MRLAQEPKRITRLRGQLARLDGIALLPRAEAERRARLDDPKRRAAITAYRIERERAEKQGKRVLRAIDDYRRTVPEFVYEAPTMFRLLPGRR